MSRGKIPFCHLTEYLGIKRQDTEQSGDGLLRGQPIALTPKSGALLVGASPFYLGCALGNALEPNHLLSLQAIQPSVAASRRSKAGVKPK